MIVAAFAGTGKSTLASKYPDKIVDFVCMPYKYYLDHDDDAGEAGKASLDNVMREDWPWNYIEAIKSALIERKILLIPSDYHVLSLLCLEEMPYTLCYPQRDAKEVYRKRFIDRGNTETFLSVFIDGWDGFEDTLEQDSYGRHIVMKPHQFLSGVIDLIFSQNLNYS